MYAIEIYKYSMLCVYFQKLETRLLPLDCPDRHPGDVKALRVLLAKLKHAHIVMGLEDAFGDLEHGNTWYAGIPRLARTNSPTPSPEG